MSGSFTVRLEEKDWNPTVGGWHCSALSIPSASIGRVYSSGVVVDSAKFQVDIPNRMIRWPGNDRPELIAIDIVLEKGLTTSTSSAWITALTSIVTALVAAIGTYLAAGQDGKSPDQQSLRRRA